MMGYEFTRGTELAPPPYQLQHTEEWPVHLTCTTLELALVA